MVGGTRHGRAVKLALLVGLVLVVLYFLISWRMEAQTQSKYLAIAEKEYEDLLKRYNRQKMDISGD